MHTLSESIEEVLRPRSLSINDSQKLAKAIKNLSDQYTQKFYLENVWKSELNQAAYLSYYFPLNFIRLNHVFLEAQNLGFFESLQRVYDIGSGTGVSHIIWQELFPDQSDSFYCVERSKEAIELHQEYLAAANLVAPANWNSLDQVPKVLPENSFCIFSYSLNEMEHIPEFALSAEAILIVEPSTRNEGRDLMELRDKMLTKGFYSWAPCTHQEACPLLNESKKDWCHNRVNADLPDWLLKIEDYLPMKNRTLTYSYLLLHKKPPPENLKGQARVIGDTLKEKGKVKQLICRGDKREFISWLTKHGKPPFIERGSLIQIPEGTEVKGNELRL